MVKQRKRQAERDRVRPEIETDSKLVRQTERQTGASPQTPVCPR